MSAPLLEIDPACVLGGPMSVAEHRRTWAVIIRTLGDGLEFGPVFCPP